VLCCKPRNRLRAACQLQLDRVGQQLLERASHRLPEQTVIIANQQLPYGVCDNRSSQIIIEPIDWLLRKAKQKRTKQEQSKT
jgi:hypothetical protein